MKRLIIGTEQNKNSVICTGVVVICTGVVALASPAARTINYHLVCFALIIWQFGVGLYTEWFRLGFYNTKLYIKQ